VRNKLEHKTRPDRMLLPERISEADSLNFECSPPHQERPRKSATLSVKW
jgi:hypothetical protein